MRAGKQKGSVMVPSPTLRSMMRPTRWSAAAALLLGVTCFASTATADPVARSREGYTVRADGPRADARRSASVVRQARAPEVAPARRGNSFDFGSTHFCP